MLQPDEKFIFGLFREGDIDAYKYFFDKFSKPLTLFAIRLFDNKAEAEDTVADTFHKLYINRHTIKSIKHMDSWLYLVIKNKAIDYRKHQLVVARAGEEMGNLQRLAENEDPELERIKSAAANKLHEDLRKAVDRLPAQRQQIIRLYFFQGKSTAEIAAQLDISTQTVLNAKNKAIKTLHKKLRYDISTYLPKS